MGTQPQAQKEPDPPEFFGYPLERREDPALITGEAQFTDDIHRPNLAYMAVLRSQHAHAHIEAIDVAAAEELDGVLGVFTADDLRAAGTPGKIPAIWELPGMVTPAYPILTRDTARHQGDPLAVVVAEDRYTANDAVNEINVTYDRLPAVTDPKAAVERDGPVIHGDAEDNVAFSWKYGDVDKTDRAFAEADRTIDITIDNNRLIPNAMEPRASIAEYQPHTDQLVIHVTSQIPHIHRSFLAEILGLPENHLRVVAPEVGGGFGSKAAVYAEDALTAWCAMQVGRPVKWQATRSESFLTDRHGRDHRTTAELAVTDAGELLGMRVDTYANLGAYISTFAAAIPSVFYGPLIRGAYQIPTLHCTVTGAFTNTAPLDAYRGAGRPEATFVIERLIDTAARELGVDPAEFRREQFLPPDKFPPSSGGDRWFYVGGDYTKALDKALALVEYDDFRDRQMSLREHDRYLGIGVSSFIEACGAAPSEAAGQFGALGGFFESSTVQFQPSGTVTVYCGTAGHGQGHTTTFSQIAAEKLGVPIDDIEVVEGDTGAVPQGVGTFGSRSAPVGGSAIAESADKVLEKAETIAAHKLEVDVADIEFAEGEFFVSGAPEHSIDIQTVAHEANTAHDLPDGLEPGLEATSSYDPEGFTFPFGTHVAVVEVDPATGEVDILRYVAVDDVGNRINPKIVEGQIQGGVAQGIGQAMCEVAVYDENGNLLAGSMQDYAVPKATQIPDMEQDETVTPCPHNPLGVKGVGEAGSIAAPPAVVNAVVDALEPFGVTHVDMPVSNEAVWRAVHQP